MIAVKLFRVPAFSGSVLVNFISVFALSEVLFFISQYLQLARGLGPLQAGLAQLPAAGSAMSAVAVVGFLLTRFGRGRAIGVALISGPLGLGLVAALENSEQLVWVLRAVIPLGLGIGVAETLWVDAVDSLAAATAVFESVSPAFEAAQHAFVSVMQSTNSDRRCRHDPRRDRGIHPDPERQRRRVPRPLRTWALSANLNRTHEV